MNEAELAGHVDELQIKSIIGFDGGTIKGLLVHPDGVHAIYPLGNKVTIYDLTTKKQRFLFGHTNIISAIDVSNSGKYIASGQINHIGFKASVIIWNMETMKQIAQHELHKVRVEALTFSSDDKYVITLGGRDCGSVVVWDMEAGQVLCGAQVSRGIQGDAVVLLPMARRGPCFLTAGDNHLAIWKIDKEARYLNFVDVNMRKLKRYILCMDANKRDEFCYCGTTTGDLIKVVTNFDHDVEKLQPTKAPYIQGCFARITKKKLPRGSVHLYEQGIRTVKKLEGDLILIGAGDGTVELVEETNEVGHIPECNIKFPSIPALKVLKSTNVMGSVTTIAMRDKNTIFVTTTNSEVFKIMMDTFRAELTLTCHTSAIYDIAFPVNFSEVFATASKYDIRVWSLLTMQELLRIKVLNFSCSGIRFSHDGKCILTAWSDGVIRSFTPLTGRLIYAILNAHNKGVSAIATTSHGGMLVTGGCEGQVRLWEVSPYRQLLMCTLKEHKGPVSALHVNSSDKEAVSASTDGTCIIWDLIRQCRRQILFANTMFMCVRYFPTGVQILTGGSDRKLAFWEVFDGGLVRELEGSLSGTINCLDISPDGDVFVSGGNDQILKLWKYQEGVTTHIGIGHSGVITSCQFSPDQRYIVTASAAGSVFVWYNPMFPKEEAPIEEEIPTPPVSLKPIEREENIRDLPTARSNQSKSTSSDGVCCRSIKPCICSQKSSEKSVKSPSQKSGSKHSTPKPSSKTVKESPKSLLKEESKEVGPKSQIPSPPHSQKSGSKASSPKSVSLKSGSKNSMPHIE